MKKSIISALALAAGIALTAQADVMKVQLTDGTVHTFNVDDVSEVTFAEGETSEEGIAGTYTGTQKVAVGGFVEYTTELSVTISENADGSINVTFPQYSIAGTMMGDLTLGTITLENLQYDEAKGGYYLDYSDLGLTLHFKAEQNGTATMDNDYVLGATSTITVVPTDGGVEISNPFKLGAMPFDLVATFNGSK